MLDKDLKENILWSNNYFTVMGEPKNLKISQKVSGAVAIPTDSNRFLLIKIKRKDGIDHWEFPRGFQLKDETYIQTAVRELKEETNLGTIGMPKELGYVMPDSGILDSRISIVRTPVSFTQNIKLQKEEKISDYKIVDKGQLATMIGNNEIVDGYTLAGVAKILLGAKSEQRPDLNHSHKNFTLDTLYNKICANIDKTPKTDKNYPQLIKQYNEICHLKEKAKSDGGLTTEDVRETNKLADEWKVF